MNARPFHTGQETRTTPRPKSKGVEEEAGEEEEEEEREEKTTGKKMRKKTKGNRKMRTIGNNFNRKAKR